MRGEAPLLVRLWRTGVSPQGFNVIASGAKQSHPLLDIYDREGIASSSFLILGRAPRKDIEVLQGWGIQGLGKINLTDILDKER
jgi:hypothetical protein